MAAFDPDAYLSALPKGASITPPPAFDPDAYLSAATQPQYGNAVPQLDVTGAPIRQEAIPGQRQPSRGMLDFAVGIPEAALTLGSGAVAGVVAPYVAAGEEILGGRYGTGSPETERRATELTQKYTYKPTSRTGQELVGAAGEAMQSLNLPPVPGAQGIAAASMAPAALIQGANIVGREAGYLSQAAKQIPAITARNEARVAKSFSQASQIDAGNLAVKYNIKLNPAVSNPSRLTRFESMLVGDRDISAKFAAENAPVWTRETKKALGLDETETLNAETFSRLKNAPDITEAYDVVRKNPAFVADKTMIASLDDLQAQARVGDVGGKGAAKINNKLESIKIQLAEGVSGDVLLDSIRDLRAQAASLYAKGKPGKPLKPGDMQLADLNLATADALESMIESTLSGKALVDFRTARTRYAQINSAEAATNIATGQVDPMVFAKMVQDGRPLSGPMADLGRIAANFPDIAKPSAGANFLQRGATTLTRAGVPGTVGFAIGNVPGAVIGAAAGEIGSRVLASRMGTPGYQARRAVPRDFRPQQPINALRPVEPGQSNIAPFDPRNNPNFTLPENETLRVRINAGSPDARQPTAQMQAAPANALRLGFSGPEDVIGALRAEDARRMRMAQTAETKGLATETAERQSAGMGLEFDLDPMTGRLKPTTGEPTTLASPVSSLDSAVQKLAKNQRFAMTADEMVAWNRTTVELAELMPGMKTLSQKAIAERMMDRKWVTEAIKKAQEKDLAFENIAKQAKDAQLVQQAQMAREKLQDTLDMLEESLSNIRPDNSRKGQGPKTRAAQTNNLRSGGVTNGLIEVIGRPE